MAVFSWQCLHQLNGGHLHVVAAARLDLGLHTAVAARAVCVAGGHLRRMGGGDTQEVSSRLREFISQLYISTASAVQKGCSKKLFASWGSPSAQRLYPCHHPISYTRHTTHCAASPTCSNRLFTSSGS